MSDYVKDLLKEVKAKNPAEPEFHQAVTEVLESLSIVMDKHPEYRAAKIMEESLNLKELLCSEFRGLMIRVKSESTVVSGLK